MTQQVQRAQKTPDTASMLLDVRHLSVDYNAFSGTVHAVNDVSISLRRGEILGLAGESGSGKSTLAYAISRLLRPPALITGGEILYYPRSDRGNDIVSQVALTRPAKNGKRGRERDEDDGQAIDLLKL